MLKDFEEHITIPSNAEYLDTIRTFIADASHKIGFNEQDTWKIVLAVDEACSNVIRHGYKLNTNNFICIDIELTQDRFLIHIEDEGQSYDLRFHKAPSQDEYLSKPKPGGLGIKIIQNLIDEIDYTRYDNKNRLSLTKFLPEQHSNS
jgi:serine/threonine-protein kinase RsbW